MFKKLACLLFLTATQGAAQPATLETSTGPLDLPATPERVVVINVANLDTISALGIQPVGVPAELYVDYMDGTFDGVETVGSLSEPDFEAIAALWPDLIVAGYRSADLVSSLGRIAPTADMTMDGEMIAEAFKKIDAYGALFNKQAEAQALAAELRQKLDAAKAAVQDQGAALIVMTNGPKVTAYNANGRFGWLHTEIGLPEAKKGIATSTHGEVISFEYIREVNPDILIVLDRLAAIGDEGQNALATLDNALVRETNAWKNGKVVQLTASNLYIAPGGARSLAQTLDEITDAFEDM